ncbi:hypothetical protein ALC57_07831 [Trachymyrmex cornetzi]|uniref:Uncharacterized protein n=1 Tax=Trachymyrmex cornetzi TaxID=471704 RepID=A0A195E3X8_9HYME|nr:hypothetical protein ALC57_07831 [Trachymyrmex cornetzi]
MRSERKVVVCADDDGGAAGAGGWLGSTMHQSVHLSRGKKGERAYWQGEAFSNRLAPVPRILHPLGHALSFIMERNKTSRDEVHNVWITILKRSVVNFIYLRINDIGQYK